MSGLNMSDVLALLMAIVVQTLVQVQTWFQVQTVASAQLVSQVTLVAEKLIQQMKTGDVQKSKSEIINLFAAIGCRPDDDLYKLAHSARKKGIVQPHRDQFEQIHETAEERAGALHRAIAQAIPRNHMLTYKERSIKGLINILRSMLEGDSDAEYECLYASMDELITLREVVRIRNITFVALHGNAPGFDQF